jgi:hypothetical protein
VLHTDCYTQTPVAQYDSMTHQRTTVLHVSAPGYIVLQRTNIVEGSALQESGYLQLSHSLR